MTSLRQPDFLIIGAPRSGTTYLARNLANHPAIAIASSKDDPFANDVHFFDINTPKGSKNYQRGWEWYLEQFEDLTESSIIGEKTADYLTDPDAPELIHRHLPEAKLIAILRDPVERAQSHFWHSRHRLPNNLKLSDLVNGGQDIDGVWVLESGFYARQLERYLKFFREDQILVLLYEDIHESPRETLTKVCRFLGVDAESADFSDAYNKINASSGSLSSQMIARIGASLKKSSPRLYDSLLNGAPSQVTKWLLRVLRNKQVKSTREKSHERGYPQMDNNTKQALREMYKEDMDKLSSMIDRDLSESWGKPHR